MTGSTLLGAPAPPTPGPSEAGRSRRWPLLGLGALLAAWAAADPRFRDVSGYPSAAVCLPLAGAAAALVAGLARGSRFERASLWLSLALLGQAASLRLVEAGPAIGYQHLPAWSDLFTRSPAAVAMLLLQAIAVLLGLGHRARGIVARMRRALPGWRLPTAGVVLVLVSAVPSIPLPVFAGELLLASALQALHLATVVLAVSAVPADAAAAFGRAADRFLDRSDGSAAGGAGVDRVALLAAAWVAVLSAVLAVLVYERHPHVPDEVSYLIQAGYFARGLLDLPAPPVPAAFDIDLIQHEGTRIFSPFPPGWPAALALGVKLGVPWLVNPLLAGLNVLGVSVLLNELYGRRTARLAVLLLACSPWYVFLAMSFMAHTFTLTCALAGALGVIAARRTGRTVWTFLGGLAIGAVSLIRPLDGLAVALLLGLWSIGLGGRALRPLATAALIAGSLVGGVANLWYNRAMTGDPRVFPVMDYFDKYFGPGSNALGFGPERGMGWSGLDPFPGHGFRDVLLNADLNAFMINADLFGWGTGSLLLALYLLFSRRMRRSDRALWAASGIVVALQSLYWFSGGPDFGARYWYLVLVPLVGLTARGAEELGAALAETGEEEPQRRVALGLVALCVGALVCFFPWRALDKYHHFRGMRAEIRTLAERHDFGRSLVLIRGRRHRDYASAAVYNPPDLRGDRPIYAWDRDSATTAAVIAAFPDRPVWYVDGPTLTGRGYQIVRGPLPPLSEASE